jgi:ASC-1-like (ASCH) protein
MLYQMKLQEEPFERMQRGEKLLEMRIYDDKRQRLKLGDHIEFADASDMSKTIRTEIVGLLRYRNFSDLIDDVPAEILGFEESEKDYLKASIFELFTKEEEEASGVVGIRIRLLGKEA